ncbi:MAG: tetratricopeptide repeat protein [Candidatus Aenigmarchaeota archaeon]|nr:tetratricopeptide repeat protein [Candidatus Aenigmarchaeota archaeon]
MNIFDVMKEEKKFYNKEKLQHNLDDLLEKIKKSRRDEKFEKTALLFREAGNVAHLLGDSRASEFYMSSAQENLKAKNMYNAAWAYRNAALVSFENGDYGNTISFSQKSAELFEKSHTQYGLEWCFNLMGEALEKTGKNSEAIKYYKKSLDIQKDEEIEERVSQLMKKTPEISVDHNSDKDSVKENGNAEFRLEVRNLSNGTIKEIKVMDSGSKMIDSLGNIKPNEIHVFKKSVRAGKNGVSSPFSRIEWETSDGDKTEREIEPIEIKIKPNVGINAYFREKPSVGKQSFFVVFVRNDSEKEITNVCLHMDFPVEIRVKPVTGYVLEKIQPGEEKGFVFKVLPTALESVMLKPSVTYEHCRRNFEETMEPFFMKDTLELPEDKTISREPSRILDNRMIEKMNEAREEKRFIVSRLEPFQISEIDFIEFQKEMASVNTGFSLKNTKIEETFSLIKEELKDLYLVSERRNDESCLLLYSCKTRGEGETYLLKIVIKEERGIVFVVSRLYSDKEDGLDDLLTKISRVLEHTITAMTFATEVQNIEVNETINIIDSVVQRSKIGGDEDKTENKKIKLKDSVVQKTDL